MAAQLEREWLRYALALLGVGLVTLVLLALRAEALANASMLYIIVVLVAAVSLGRGPSIVAALAAFGTSNFFLVEPRLTFHVANPDDWVALILLLLTAIVTGQLAAGQRARARDATEHERQAQVLYDIAVLMGGPKLPPALEAVSERLRTELGVLAVLIEVTGPDGRLLAAAITGEPTHQVALRQARSGGSEVLAPMRAAAGTPGSPTRWIRVAPPAQRSSRRGLGDRLLRVPIEGADARGEVVLLTRRGGTFGPASSRLLSAVAAQLGPAVERARLREQATDAEVLRRTDETKSALLDAVSHDLRTPLASIVTSAGSLLDSEVAWSEAERRGFAETIENEATRLNRIVTNLLDLSRIEGGSLKPDRAWFDAASLVHEVLDRLRPLTQRHTVLVDAPDVLRPVLLDYSQIDQVLSNLIENAARYSPPRSDIRVTAGVEGNDLVISVEDSGPGISGVDPDRLFEPFYRPRGGVRPSGIGLGLAVARGLVEAHGGTIRAANLPSGGARFEFSIPTPEPAAVEPAS
ncbi:MAG: sensor histidine kinase [Candidatus Limnocylindria bacterium]